MRFMKGETMAALVKKEFVQVVERVDDWTQAIELSMEPLLKHECIERRYVEAIFDKTQKYGPYYVIAPKIAMPHASFDQGVLSKAISVLLIKQPVKFSKDGFDVHLVVGLAATDSQSHLQSLVKLSEMLDDKDKLDQILEASSSQELYEFFRNI